MNVNAQTLEIALRNRPLSTQRGLMTPFVHGALCVISKELLDWSGSCYSNIECVLG